MVTLTKKQKEIFDFVQKYIKKNGISPTFEEICDYAKKAFSTVHEHVQALVDKGYLIKNDKLSRGLEINDKNDEMVKIPLLGTIAAGQPIEVVEEKETIAIPKYKLLPRGRYFGLRVTGDSMIDENINDGDVIIVKQQDTAENGQKVVALINNHEATLKKFYKEKGGIKLEPANKLFEPIIIKRGQDIKVQGIVIDVIQNEYELKNQKDNHISNTVPVQQESSIRKKPVNNLNDLTAQEWIQETISVFIQKGLGLGHEDTKIERQHPAPFSFQDVGRLIKFFTKKGQRVLDPFSGVGSTLKACALNNREGVGIEIVKKYVDLTKERLKKELKDDLFGNINKNQKVIYGDALEVISDLPDNHFDFIVTSPPYWNILNKIDHKVKQERIAHNLDIKYSDLKKDIGNITSYDEFIDVLSSFFNQCARILKPKKYLCIIVSDFRHKDKFFMFHSDLAQRLEAGNYALKGITVLYQRHKKIFPYGYPYSYVPNIHHQYILILQNKKIDTTKGDERK